MAKQLQNPEQVLFADIKQLIDSSRQRVAVAVNAEITMLAALWLNHFTNSNIFYMKSFVILIVTVSFLSSCRKDETQVIFNLPQQSQSGENTFGLLLNNSVWTNYGQVCFPFAGGCRENLKGIFYKNDGDLLINADRVIYKDGSRFTSESFEINLKTKFNGAWTYSTSTNDTISIAYYFKTTSPFDTMYILPQTNPTFSIKISRLDTINNILSGEFSGKLFKRIDYSNYTTSLTDSINIKDGRFDIKLK